MLGVLFVVFLGFTRAIGVKDPRALTTCLFIYYFSFRRLHVAWRFSLHLSSDGHSFGFELDIIAGGRHGIATEDGRERNGRKTRESDGDSGRIARRGLSIYTLRYILGYKSIGLAGRFRNRKKTTTHQLTYQTQTQTPTQAARPFLALRQDH